MGMPIFPAAARQPPPPPLRSSWWGISAATVLSQAADAAALSLFEQLQRAGSRVTMLQEQYRMHPDISR